MAIFSRMFIKGDWARSTRNDLGGEKCIQNETIEHIEKFSPQQLSKTREMTKIYLLFELYFITLIVYI